MAWPALMERAHGRFCLPGARGGPARLARTWISGRHLAHVLRPLRSARGGRSRRTGSRACPCGGRDGRRPQRGSVCLHAGTLKTFHLYDAQRRFITAIHLCQTVFIIVYGFFNKPSPRAKFMPRSSFFFKKKLPSPPCWFGKFLNPV